MRETLTPEQYFQHPALSQSELKVLLSSPKVFKAMKEGKLEPEEKKRYFHIGGLVDCKLLTPNEFDKYYCLMPETMNTPSSPQEVAFCEALYGGATTHALEALEMAGYKTASEKMAVEKLEKFGPYLDFMSGLENRTPFSFKDGTMVQACVASVMANELARRFIIQEGVSQQGIVFNLMGIECKALPDRLYLDFQNKLARITDLKTTGDNLESFKYSVRRFGYHIQAAFYGLGVKNRLQDLGENPGNWKIESYLVVAEKKPLNECAVFRLPDAAIMDGMKRVREGLEAYKWHKENNIWDKTREEYDNGGIRQLAWDFSTPS